MSTEQELAAVAEASYEAEAMEFCEIDKAFNRDKMMSDMAGRARSGDAGGVRWHFTTLIHMGLPTTPS
jgi:hypothetical protein